MTKRRLFNVKPVLLLMLMFGCNIEDKQPYPTFIKYIANNPNKAGGSILPILIELQDNNLAMLSLVEQEKDQKSVVYFTVSILDPQGNKITQKTLTDLPNALPISQGEFSPLARNLLKYRCGGLQQTPSGQISVIGSVVDTILGNPVSKTFINLFDSRLEQKIDIDLRSPGGFVSNEGFVGATLAPSPISGSLYAFSSYNKLNNQTKQYSFDLYFAKAQPNQTTPEIEWIKFFGSETDQDLACKIISIPYSNDAIWAATASGNDILRYRLGRINDKGAVVWTQLIKGNAPNDNVAVSDIYFYGNSIMVLGCYGSDLSAASKVYLANFDLDGNLNWSKLVEIEAASAYGMQLEIAADNNLVISGHLREREDDDMNMFLSKISPTGTLLWLRVYQTVGEDFNSGVLGLKDGSFWVYGTCFPTATSGLIGLIKTDNQGLISK